MICFFCHKRISGADVPRRIEWRRSPLGEVKVYGDGAPDGKLSVAAGTLVRLSHSKCFHAFTKQQELAAARAADPEAQPRPEQDWRQQTVLDVEELAGNEGDRDHRGT
jgi:hypothetical protein